MRTPSNKDGGAGGGLNLPLVELKTRMEDGIVKVFDRLRKKYVALTPEEFVRQHFVSYLTDRLHYPEQMMSNEVKITLNDTTRRCDTIIFAPDMSPLMIVEYKAPSVTVCQDTFDQIVRYNMKLHTRYLVVSNGLNHYCCVIDYGTGNYSFLPAIPDYEAITRGM